MRKIADEKMRTRTDLDVGSGKKPDCALGEWEGELRERRSDNGESPRRGRNPAYWGTSFLTGHLSPLSVSGLIICLIV
jgi:hypothetical protein